MMGMQKHLVAKDNHKDHSHHKVEATEKNEEPDLPKEKVTHLSEDFYAISFVSFLVHVEEEFHVTRQMQGRNFYACLWIFLIQITLIILIFKSVVFDQEHFVIVTPNVSVYITRFLTSMILHMELIGDVK